MELINPKYAVIAWTPPRTDHPSAGQIEVRSRAADRNEHWTDKYICSGGAITMYHTKDAIHDPKGYAYRWFVYLTTEYHMDPHVVAAELKKIRWFEPWKVHNE